MGTTTDVQFRLAERFVSDALQKFLVRSWERKPSKGEIAALIWGYQVGLGKLVSTLDISRALRARIAELERSAGGGGEMKRLVETLRVVHEAIPEVGARFSYSDTRPENFLNM